MDSTTLSVSRSEAKEKLTLLNQATKKLGVLSDDDRLLMKAYREIQKGHKLINVNDAFREAGINIAGIPRLAIARADRNRVFWERSTQYNYQKREYLVSGGGVFNYRNRQTRIADDRHLWKIPGGTFPLTLRDHQSGSKRLCALCPYIPAAVRPQRGLGNYFILFEANWFWTSDRPVVPTDPFLLRQIDGPLMAIRAEWDLSPLEQQILQSVQA